MFKTWYENIFTVKLHLNGISRSIDSFTLCSVYIIICLWSIGVIKSKPINK
jgi:hypothetical protein